MQVIELPEHGTDKAETVTRPETVEELITMAEKAKIVYLTVRVFAEDAVIYVKANKSAFIEALREANETENENRVKEGIEARTYSGDKNKTLWVG